MIRRPAPALLALALLLPGGARVLAEGDEAVPVERLLDDAEQAFLRGRYTDATRSLDRAATAPGGLPPEGWHLRARLLEETGDPAGALEAATNLAKARPGDAPAAARRGRLLFETGRIDEAREALSAAVEAFPLAVTVRTAWGDLLRATGKRAEAVAAWEEANTIWASSDLTAPEDLVAAARARVGIFETDPEVRRALNSTLEILGPPAAAGAAAARGGVGICETARAVRRALNSTVEILGPPAKAGDAAARVLIADIYTRHDETGKVPNALRPLLDRNPGHPDALAVLAEAREKRFESVDAAKNAREALRTDPTHPRAAALLAELALADGRTEEALELLDRALAARPRERTLLALRAIPLYLDGDHGAHGKAVDGILALDPTFGRAWVLLARVLENRRRFAEAATAARRGTEIDARDPEAWFTLARNLLNDGHEEEAKKALETSNAVDPWNAIFRNNFRGVLEELDGYVTGSTEHTVLLIHPSEDTVLRPLYEEALEKSYGELRARYGFTPEGPLLIEVFRNAADFSARTLGIPGFGAIGACFGRVVTLDSPGALPPGAFCWRSTAHHELAHVYSLQLSKGRVPRWLTEGLAVWEEKRAHASWQRNMERELVARMANGQIPGIESINGSFRGEEIMWAYYQGGLMAEWMERDYGWPKVLEMLRLYGSDLSDGEVVRRALGVSPEEFDDAFMAFLEERTAGWSVRAFIGDDRMRELRERSNRDPADLEAHLGYAEACLQRDKKFDAGTPLARAKAVAPDDARLTELRGRLAMASDPKPDRGLELLREALKGGVDHYDLRMALGRAAAAENRPDEAIEHFRRAKILFPRVLEPGDARVALHALHVAGGRADDALRELEERLAMSESDLAGRLKVAGVYEDRGDLEGVERVLSECIDIRPLPGPLKGAGLPGDLYDAAGVFDSLGRTRLALQRPADAVKAFRSAIAVAITQDPKKENDFVADLHVDLARALLATGAAEDARAAAAEALRRVPGHPAATLFLKEAGK